MSEHILPLLSFKEAKNIIENDFIKGYKHYMGKAYKRDVETELAFVHYDSLHSYPSVLFYLMFDFVNMNQHIYTQERIEQVSLTDRFIGSIDLDSPNMFAEFLDLFDIAIKIYKLEEVLHLCQQKYDSLHEDHKRGFAGKVFCHFANIININVNISVYGGNIFMFLDRKDAYYNIMNQDKSLYRLCFDVVTKHNLLTMVAR